MKVKELRFEIIFHQDSKINTYRYKLKKSLLNEKHRPPANYKFKKIWKSRNEDSLKERKKGTCFNCLFTGCFICDRKWSHSRMWCTNRQRQLLHGAQLIQIYKKLTLHFCQLEILRIGSDVNNTITFLNDQILLKSSLIVQIQNIRYYKPVHRDTQSVHERSTCSESHTAGIIDT